MTSSSPSSSPPTSSSPGDPARGARCHRRPCGEICPFTFVRTKLALEALPIGGVLRVLVDHEPATRNIPRSAAEWGQEVLRVTASGRAPGRSTSAGECASVGRWPDRDRQARRAARHLRGYGRVVVAFSGGVDSAFLLKVAADTLGDACHAVTAVSETMARSEIAEATALGAELASAPATASSSRTSSRSPASPTTPPIAVRCARPS